MNKKNLKAGDVRKRPKKIKLTEKEYFKIFDNSTNGIVIINAQNEKIEDANQVFVKMLGMAKKEFTGKKLWEIGAFIDARKTKEIIRQTKRNKHYYCDDFSIKTKSGIMDTELAGHLHGIDHQKIIQLNICDITIKKNGEKTVKRSEEKFREIFDDCPELIIVIDGKGVILEANKLVDKWLKYKRNDIVGKNILKLDFLTLKSKKIVVDKIKKRFSKKPIKPYELEFINKKNEIRIALISGNLMKGEREGEWRDLIFVNDITEREQAREKIQESEEKFRNIFENSRDGLIIADSKKRNFVMVNKSACQTLGYSEKEMFNLSVDDIHPKKELAYVLKQFEKLVQGKISLVSNIPVKKKNGDVFYADVMASPVFIEGKKHFLGTFRDVTEMNKMKEKLLKIKFAVESSNDAIGLSDSMGRHFYQNKAFSKLLGYETAEELQGLGGGPRLYSDEKVAKEVFGNIMSGKSWIGETEMLTKNGRRLTVSLHADSIKDEDGKVIGLIGIHSDITERKKTEEEVKKLASIVRYSTELVNMANAKGEMIFLNEAGAGMLGIKQEECEKYNILDVIPDNAMSLVKEELLPALQKGRKWEGDLQYKNLKTKEIIDVHATTFPIKDEETGRIICFANVSLDITERKKIEETINREKAKDDAILAGLGEGLIIVGNDEKIQYVNEAAEAMLGWRNEEVKGEMFFDAVKVVDEKGLPFQEGARPLEIAIKTGKKVFSKLSDGLHYVKKDKTVFPVSITISPITLKGKLAGFVNVFRDITREKDIDKVKTEFVSLTSHQLRTPITSINWNTEMLLNGDAGSINEKQKELLKEIYDSNKRMTNLINALLNVSRLELGTFIVEPEAVDVAGVVRHNLQEMALMIKTNKIEIAEKYDPEVKTLMADPKLLDIIIQNLLSNAIKYTKDGKVEVETKRSDGHIILKVSDNGIGIPKAQQKNVYTKLFRADNAKVKDADGTGLGLYIVKLILEACGGKIWFKSEEGKGTDFYVSLPTSGMKKKEGVKKLI